MLAGQCVNDNTDRYLGIREKYENACKNLRDANYICDAVIRNSKSWWTIDDGYCLPFSLPYQILQLDTTNKVDPCSFILKCALNNGLDQSCNCQDSDECGQLLTEFCPDPYLLYPSPNPFLLPYGILWYKRDRNWGNKKPDGIAFEGRIKCLGYQFITNDLWIYHFDEKFFLHYQYQLIEYVICNMKHTEDENEGLQNFQQNLLLDTDRF